MLALIAAALIDAPSPTPASSASPTAGATSTMIPNGSYSYDFRQGQSRIGTTVIAIARSGASLTTHEVAALGNTFTVDQVVDESTFTAQSMHAVYPGAKPTTIDVAFGTPSFQEKVAGSSARPLTPISGGKGVVVLDGPVMCGFFLAAAQQHLIGSTLMSGVSAGSATVLPVVLNPAPSAKRPAGVASADVAFAATGLPSGDVIIWVDPSTFVPQDFEIPAQGISIVLVQHSASTANPPAPSAPTPLPTAAVHFQSEDVTFASRDGTKLAGTITIPDHAAGPMPAVVLVHGSGAIDRNETIGPNPIFLELSNALSNHGFVVLRYDKRGVGKSGGDLRTLTRDQLLADARAAIDTIRARHEVDPKRAYVVGHSEGGELAPSLAAAGAPLRGIALMAPPAVPLDRILVEQATHGLTGAAREKVAEEQARANLAIRTGTLNPPGATWLRSSFGIDPADIIKRVPCPILILQGGKDFQVLATDLPRLVAAARSAKRAVTVRVFPNDDHLFITVPTGQTSQPAEYLAPHHIDPAMVDALLGWLRTH